MTASRRPMPSGPTSTEPTLATVAARWKRVRGRGLDAVYRASCGKGGCPGFLGELRYAASGAQQAIQLRDYARRERECLQVIADGGPRGGGGPAVPEWARDLDLDEALDMAREREEEVARLLEVVGDDVEKYFPESLEGWWMRARPYASRQPTEPELKAVYAGYADTGYRISLGGKRSLDGLRIGRRPSLEEDAPPVFRELRGTHAVEGQLVGPTDRIWCRVCGVLNQLDGPAELRDSQAPRRVV